MSASSQQDFRATELDPALLSTPFEVQTNWHVITGAASCGKTTFMLDPLPFEENGAGDQDAHLAGYLEE